MRHFRFSLRLLLVAMTIVAVLLAVWAEGARKQRAGVAWVLKQGGHISFDYQGPEADGTYRTDAKPPGPKWLRDRLGIDYLATVTGVILDRDEITDLAPLTNLPGLRSVALMNHVHPNTDFSPLQELPHLEELYLCYTGIDAQTAKSIKAALPRCRIHSETNPELEN